MCATHLGFIIGDLNLFSSSPGVNCSLLSSFRRAMGLHSAVSLCMHHCADSGIVSDDDGWFKTVVLVGGTSCLPGLSGWDSFLPLIYFWWDLFSCTCSYLLLPSHHESSGLLALADFF